MPKFAEFAEEKKTILTSEGLKKLEEELNTLRTQNRKEVAEKLKEALSFGDLSENSEYDEAKNEQAKLEARILRLENMLKNVKILDSNYLTNDVIQVGSKVTIEDLQQKNVLKYRIVGPMETNPDDGKISDESPVGKSLIGHKVGDIVKIKIPIGVVEYKILNIGG